MACSNRPCRVRCSTPRFRRSRSSNEERASLHWYESRFNFIEFYDISPNYSSFDAKSKLSIQQVVSRSIFGHFGLNIPLDRAKQTLQNARLGFRRTSPPRFQQVVKVRISVLISYVTNTLNSFFSKFQNFPK